MKLRTLSLLILPICAATFVVAQLNAPKAGIVRYPDGSVHTVFGLPANYVVDPAHAATADAVSFSDTAGLIARDGRITLVDGTLKTIAEYDSGEAAPLVNVDGDLNSAVAWLPTRHALLRWNGTAFAITEVNGTGGLAKVTSVRLDRPDTAKLLATNPDSSVSEATISLSQGELTTLDILPGVRGPAFRQHSFVVFRDEHGLEIATSTAIVRTLPLPPPEFTGDLTFERMSSDSLHLISTGTKQSWVLHLGNSAAPLLYQLPEPPAHSTQTLPVVGEVQK